MRQQFLQCWKMFDKQGMETWFHS